MTAVPAKVTFEGQVADQLVAVIEANKTALISELTSAEGGLESFIASLINAIPAPSNLIEAQVWNFAKPFVISGLVSLETSNPGSVLYTLIDTAARNIAKELGG